MGLRDKPGNESGIALPGLTRYRAALFIVHDSLYGPFESLWREKVRPDNEYGPITKKADNETPG